MSKDKPVLEVRELSKTFVPEKGFFKSFFKRKNSSENKVKALSSVSFALKKGETLGILGESGSGKSTLARVLMGIYPPDSGYVELDGLSLFDELKKNRLKVLSKMQMVFQDPFASLDPRMKVSTIISEPLKIHSRKTTDLQSLSQALAEVGLEASSLHRYPSEFSGGQRQRIGICRALILNPEIIIADEAVSALDVSVQAQILELLCSLRKSRDLSMIFISHDVAVVRQIADRIILFYKGQIVEEMLADCLMRDSAHPYTKRLLASALYLREGIDSTFKFVPKETKESENACCFYSQCDKANEKCLVSPTMRQIHEGHRVACHLF